MVKKGDNFFEQHVEKIVLVVAVVLSLWLLIMRVAISPSYVKFDNTKYSAGKIDSYILERYARRLEQELGMKPRPKSPYKERFSKFEELCNSPLSKIEVNLSPPIPFRNPEDSGIRPVYALPAIPGVNDVQVDRLRAAAYVPTVEINDENAYEQSNSEPNDIDLVTVQATIDVESLYGSFFESFAGDDVRADWRDPCLAKPVFAAVNLQRQELEPGGKWSAWEDVPRTSVDGRRELFEIIEDLSDLPAGGVKVRLLRFNDKRVRADLLQPIPYVIASAEEEWFPPSFHKEFSKHQADLAEAERREAKLRKRQSRSSGREQRLRAKGGSLGLRSGGRSAGLGMVDRSSGRGAMSDRYNLGKRLGIPTSEKSKRGRRADRKRQGTDIRSIQDSIEQVYQKYEKVLISDKDDLSKLREPLMFWAHDDRVEASASYRYRIRLGVFNPLAGTNQLSEQDRHLRNQAILWSGFSEPTEVVKIPSRIRFFPYGLQEVTKAVKVEIFKYVLGYWHSKKFTVHPGEVIGETVEYEADETEADKNLTLPEEIDYSIGAVLVDVGGPVKAWSGGRNMKPRSYYEMLYSVDEANIESMPLKAPYWTDADRSRFNQLVKLVKNEKKPFQGWTRKRSGRRRGRRSAPGSESGTQNYLMERLFGGSRNE